MAPDDQGDEAHPEMAIKARQQRSTRRVGRKGFSVIASLPTDEGTQHIDFVLGVQVRSQQQCREFGRHVHNGKFKAKKTILWRVIGRLLDHPRRPEQGCASLCRNYATTPLRNAQYLETNVWKATEVRAELPVGLLRQFLGSIIDRIKESGRLRGGAAHSARRSSQAQT